MPTDHWAEMLTGLGASGVELILAHAGEHPVQGHPLLPLVQVSATPEVQGPYEDDLDLVLKGPVDDWAGALLDLILAVVSRRKKPLSTTHCNTEFQFTRGLLGVSM